MNILKEFKEFAIKGNVIDLAVGVILGAAFGKVVDSLVKDVIMPPIGFLINRVDLTNMAVTIGRDPRTDSAVAIRYGAFITQTIQFLIVAAAVFLLVKQINRLRRNPQKLPPTIRECPFCASSISIKAIRCPNCTSTLESATTPENLKDVHS